MNVNQMAAMASVWGWVQLDGFEMYLAGNDCGVCLKTLYGQPYEPQSLALWKSLSIGTVVDIGAHTGVYTLTALTQGADVVSIEPYALNYARLMMNVRKNGFDGASQFPFAAADEDGAEAFSVSSNQSYCTSGGRLGGGGKKTFVVPTLRIDSVIGGPVAAIKIDVEGAAKRVLKGAERLLREHRPDLLIECTEDGLAEILAPLGYKFFVVNESAGLEPCNDLRPIATGNGWDMTRLNRYCTVRD